MRLAIFNWGQVGGYGSGRIVPNRYYLSSFSFASSISLSSFFWVALLLTWPAIDCANLDSENVTSVTLPPVIKKLNGQLTSQSINATSLLHNATTATNDRLDNDKSVPALLSLTSRASTAVSGATISDTNQGDAIDRATINGGKRIRYMQGTTSSSPSPAATVSPQVSSRNIDSNQFAQKQENVTASDLVTVTAHDDIHKTFLLMCSAQSIRFWSLSCQVHSTSTLLSHVGSRPSSIRYGITSIAIWRPSDQLGAAVELIWFDIEEKQFHRAAIQRQHISNCDELLGIDLNQTLDYRSNPYTNKSNTFLGERSVKLAIDSRSQLLFASNYMQNRIDVYRLDSATAANNEMVWLASLDAPHSMDIVLDERERTVFWIENKKRICHLPYGFKDEIFLQLNRNLTRLKQCTEELTKATPQALTLDTANRKIIWGSKRVLYRDEYKLKNDSHTEVIGYSPEENEIHNLAMIGSDTLYLSDQLEVHSLQLDSGRFELVSIEANTLFDLLLVDNLTMTSTVEYSGAEPAVERVSSMPPTAQPNHTIYIALPMAPSRISSNTILFSILVPSLLVTLCAILIFSLKKSSQFRSCASRLFTFPNGFTHYDQLRKNRASSTGRDELIVTDEDVEQNQHPQQPQYTNETLYESDGPDVLTESSRRARVPYHGHQYRQNLVRQTSAMDDIEDIFGSGGNQQQHHRVPPPTCIACRDSDICQDKGICMATYRVL